MRLNTIRHLTDAVTVCDVPTGFWSKAGVSVMLTGVCALAVLALTSAKPRTARNTASALAVDDRIMA